MNRVLNVGSMNLDYVYQVDHLVREKETMASRKMDVFPGGKGLNQSIALAKAGCCVFHAGKIGPDGQMLYDLLKSSGVRTELIHTDGEHTGNAIIQVTPSGQNGIVLYPGSNHELDIPWLIRQLDRFDSGDVLLMQNETNGVEELIRAAAGKGMRIAFNPSPFTDEIPSYPLQLVRWLIVNEVEAEGLSGEKETEQMLQRLEAMFPDTTVILTAGGQGAYCREKGETCYVPAFSVNAVDTTGAGDTFTGFYLASSIAGKGIRESLLYGSAAAALSVCSHGAASSIPDLAATEEFLSGRLD